MRTNLYPERETRRIDYATMQREYPNLKAALTRAENKGDPLAVVKAVERFVEVSDAVGCMPDDWPRWRNALEDAFDKFTRSEAGDDDYFEHDGRITKRFQAVARRFDF